MKFRIGGLQAQRCPGKSWIGDIDEWADLTASLRQGKLKSHIAATFYHINNNKINNE